MGACSQTVCVDSQTGLAFAALNQINIDYRLMRTELFISFSNYLKKRKSQATLAHNKLAVCPRCKVSRLATGFKKTAVVLKELLKQLTDTQSYHCHLVVHTKSHVSQLVMHFSVLVCHVHSFVTSCSQHFNCSLFSSWTNIVQSDHPRFLL